MATRSPKPRPRLSENEIIRTAELEASRLEAVNALAGEVHRLAESLDRLARLTADVCHAPVVVISLIDGDDQIYLAASGTDTLRVPRAETFCTHTIADGRTFHTGDARRVSHLGANPHVLAEGGIRSYAGVPIVSEGGHAVGTVCIFSPEVDAFSEDDVRRLEQIAELVGSGFRRLEAEAKARLAEEHARAARAEKAQYELALRAIAEGVHFYDSSGVIIDANESAGQMFQLGRADVVGLSYHDPAWRVIGLDGAIVPPRQLPVHQALTTGQTVRDVILGVRRADGELCWIATSAAPIHDEAGGPVAFVAVTFRDVTETLRNEAKLREALEEAERANRSKSDFLGVMSHELRTPMNAILGSAQILSAANLTKVESETLRVLGAAGQQMVTVLDDLFEMVAFDTGKVRIEPSDVRPDHIIETAVGPFLPEAAAKGVKLEVDYGAGLDALRRIDPNRVRQIAGNLLANAVKFTDAGRVTVSCRLSRNSAGQDILILDVEDTGIGIATENMERIFSPFEQADVSTRRRHGGIGVGLAVVRQLARAMGGDAAVTSEQGRGSRFRVHILAPRSTRPDAAVGAAGAAPAAFVSKNVLLVDDNPRNLFVLSTMLSGAGHEVTTADSGAGALRMLAERAFDIVLLDMVMPDIDGFDVMKATRGPGPNADTPIVACTANVLPQQVAAYSQAGAAGVLPKPVDVAEVLGMIAAVAR